MDRPSAARRPPTADKSAIAMAGPPGALQWSAIATTGAAYASTADKSAMAMARACAAVSLTSTSSPVEEGSFRRT